MSVYLHPVEENIWNSAGFMDRLTAQTQGAPGKLFANDLPKKRDPFVNEKSHV